MSYRLVDANRLIDLSECNEKMQNYINNMPAIYADIEPNDQLIGVADFNSGRFSAYDEIYNKLDAGVCDECEYEEKCHEGVMKHNFYWVRWCSENSHEREVFMKWMKNQIKEQNDE